MLESRPREGRVAGKTNWKMELLKVVGDLAVKYAVQTRWEYFKIYKKNLGLSGEQQCQMLNRSRMPKVWAIGKQKNGIGL